MCLSRVCGNHSDNPINHIPFIEEKYRPKVVQFMRRFLIDEAFDFLYGYKVLTRLRPQLEFGFPYCDHYIPRYSVGQWYKADEQMVIASDNKAYLSGFHIFLSKKSAKEFMFLEQTSIYAIAFVQFRDITSVGYQDNHPCIVARYMQVVGFLT